jgi:hypothetical protein
MMSKKHAFSMQPRDCEILEIIGLCGALTSEQIGLYVWETVGVFTDTKKVNPDGSHPPKITVQSNCQRRIKLLYEAGFVQRVERFQTLKEGKKSYFYTLTSNGAEALASVRGDIFWRKTDSRLRPNYVEHLIMTNDARLAILRQAKKDSPSGLQIIKWRDELMLAQDHRDLKIPVGVNPDKSIVYASLIPDAHAVLCTRDGHEHRYLLEADNKTETVISNNPTYRTWAYKINLYMRFIFPLKGEKESLYTKLYKAPDVKVLTVTTSQERLENLLRVSERVGAQKRFWFTTRDQVIQIGLQQIDGKTTREGNPQYKVTLPNIWADPIWRIAGDKERRLHSLSERSEMIRSQV